MVLLTDYILMEVETDAIHTFSDTDSFLLKIALLCTQDMNHVGRSPAHVPNSITL